MKSKLLVIAAILMLGASSCTKWADDWAGVYNSTSSGIYSRVVVTEIKNKVIKLELQTISIGGYATFATIANGKLTTATTVTIDEEGTIAGSSGTWRFTGSGTLNGGQLVLAGTASQPGSSNIDYAFSGRK
ncbi:MAG TPA: hypothetical protein PLW44_07700 [Chitinophagales bacterium]|nr:hypothetical protein [Chitinophagales bacterium]